MNKHGAAGPWIFLYVYPDVLSTLQYNRHNSFLLVWKFSKIIVGCTGFHCVHQIFCFCYFHYSSLPWDLGCWNILINNFRFVPNLFCTETMKIRNYRMRIRIRVRMVSIYNWAIFIFFVFPKPNRTQDPATATFFQNLTKFRQTFSEENCSHNIIYFSWLRHGVHGEDIWYGKRKKSTSVPLTF